jgi:hypothetical protein
MLQHCVTHAIALSSKHKLGLAADVKETNWDTIFQYFQSPLNI